MGITHVFALLMKDGGSHLGLHEPRQYYNTGGKRCHPAIPHVLCPWLAGWLAMGKMLRRKRCVDCNLLRIVALEIVMFF